MADENMVHEGVELNGDQYNDDENDREAEGESDIGNEAEFHAINNQLDLLNSALDNLEQKNDDIHAKLVELLQSNREARKQFQESRNEKINSTSKS